MLSRCAAVLRMAGPLIWFVVEDADAPNAQVKELLISTGIEHRYWAPGATADKGHFQRNSAFECIRSSGVDGIVYNADDDNLYDPAIFSELRKVRRVGVLPVGNCGRNGPRGVERPLVAAGRVCGWEAAWRSRKFPVDMAGFAFHSSLLETLSSPLWSHAGVGGESEFLSRIVQSEQELEPLADDCRSVLVWHNGAEGLLSPECAARLGGGALPQEGPLDPAGTVPDGALIQGE